MALVEVLFTVWLNDDEVLLIGEKENQICYLSRKSRHVARKLARKGSIKCYVIIYLATWRESWREKNPRIRGRFFDPPGNDNENEELGVRL